jgi:hypothetical protein
MLQKEKLNTYFAGPSFHCKFHTHTKRKVLIDEFFKDKSPPKTSDGASVTTIPEVGRTAVLVLFIIVNYTVNLLLPYLLRGI